MKKIIPLFTFTFTCSLFPLPCSLLLAAVPLKWTVETSRLAPAVFDVVRGETIALEAAFNSAGKPFSMDLEPVSIFWQTNGMGNAWWTAPAAATANLVRATFTPEMDPGGATVNGFLGSSGSIYRAAFTFRFRHGPGALPNALPLPQPVIDFAKVRVLNPPWSGGGGGVDTNAVRDIVREQLATNGIRSVDGAARPLPRYLHALDFDDTYPDDAAWYYDEVKVRGEGEQRNFTSTVHLVPSPSPNPNFACSAVRDGGFLYRNYDWKFDDAAEFVVRMSAGPGRFASVGVANCGTNLTEEIVTSGKWSRYYKCLPGRVVDGVNANGVCAEINVVGGDPDWHTEPTPTPVHPLAAVRWALDNATNAEHAAKFLASNIRFPQGWEQNFHYMVADELGTWIVENGMANGYGTARAVMTNFIVDPPGEGEGHERYDLLFGGANITNAWYTRAYRRETNPPWVSDLNDVLAYTNEIFDAWAAHDKEYFRGKTNNGIPWWQTVHTSIYDITNRTLRVAVQEVDDWYTFAVPSAGGVKPEAVKAIVEPMIATATNGIPEQIAALQEGKADEYSTNGWIFADGVTRRVYTNAYASDPDNRVVYSTDPNYDGSDAPALDSFYTSSSYPKDGPFDAVIDFVYYGEDLYHLTATRKRVLRTGYIPPAISNATGRIDADLTAYVTETYADWTPNSSTHDGKVYGNVHWLEMLGGWVCDETGHVTEQMYGDYTNPDATELAFPDGTKTYRKRTVTTKLATTNDVNGAISAAVSTNNPAFVSAVRETAPSPGNYAAVSNAAMNAIQAVTNADANLIYTITSDGAEPRFYFTPVGAINPED